MAELPFKQIVGIVSSHVSKGMTERKRWDKWTNWYLAENAKARQGELGQLVNGEEEITLETNYPYAFLDTMAANVVPSNAKVQIVHRTPGKKESAAARSKLVNDTFRRNYFESKLWDLCTFAGICARAFLKTTWDDDTRRPVIHVLDPRKVFYDQSVPYENTRYIFEAVALTKAEFDERVASGKYDAEVAKTVQASKIPEWMIDSEGADSHLNDASRSVFSWVVVYEFYDLAGKKFYHLLEKSGEPLFEGKMPYRYVDNPFTILVFNSNLKDSGGLSDVKLIEKAQERLNEIDTLELLYAHKSIPTPIVNEAHFDNPEQAKTAFVNAVNPGDVAVVNIPNVKIDDAISYSKPPSISPSFNTMRDRTTKIIEFVLGLPAYERGDTGSAETSATAHALVDTSSKNRNGRRVKVLERVIVSVSKNVIGLWKEFMAVDMQISIRNPRNGETTDMGRGELAFPKGGDDSKEGFNDEWYYDFDAIPYSPAEDHRLVRLQRLQQFLPVLLGNPQIDQQSLISLIAELLGMEEVKFAEPQAGGAMPPGGVPGQPGAPGSAGAAGAPAPGPAMPVGQDTNPLSGGGLPEGMNPAAAVGQPTGGASLPKM